MKTAHKLGKTVWVFNTGTPTKSIIEEKRTKMREWIDEEKRHQKDVICEYKLKGITKPVEAKEIYETEELILADMKAGISDLTA